MLAGVLAGVLAFRLPRSISCYGLMFSSHVCSMRRLLLTYVPPLQLCAEGCVSCVMGFCHHCVSGLALYHGACHLTCPADLIPHWVEATSALVCIPAPASTQAPDTEESGSGSGDDVMQPNICGCNNDNSHPVCWVDQLVTLPSLCIARCLNIQHVLVGACPSDDEGASLAVSPHFVLGLDHGWPIQQPTPFVAVEGARSSQFYCRRQPEGRHLDCPHSRPHHVRLCHHCHGGGSPCSRTPAQVR